MRAFETAIEHLDDVGAWVALLFERARVAEDRRRGFDEAITARMERIEARLAAGRAAGQPLPWDRIRVALGLQPSEQMALQVVVAIELLPSLRARMRELAADPSRVWPDVSLLAELVYAAPAARPRLLEDLALDGPLHQLRLVDVVGSARQVEDAPFLLRPLRVAPRVLEAFHGTWRLDREVAQIAKLESAAGELLMPGELEREVTALLRDADGPVVVLCGPDGAGRKSLINKASAAQRRGLLRIRCADLPLEPRDFTRAVQALLREARLFGAVPLFDRIELLAADDVGRADRGRALDLALTGFPGPIAATGPRSDRPPVQLARGVILVDIPLPPAPTREALWRRAFGTQAADEACANAAARYPITGGMIERSAASALARSRGTITDEDVQAGVRATLDSKLGAIATRVTVTQTWDDLVLLDETADEIRELIARVRHRKQVHDDWGFADKVGRGLGLSALFSGPPGTGKTMVAGLIAGSLGLDLYQIDLSRIVSKWIGETEKNLGQAFDAAEAGHAILLFDEADSLFAKRTEVKSSVDRYANLEVNYLLQRMEAFHGISILTTNLDASIDEAFRRRLSARIHFPMPESEERLRLWRAMIPIKASIAPDIDFDLLSEHYAMSGGHIRNAVIRAAFLAAADRSSITMRHLNRAAALEYAAMGKVMHGSPM
jgi:ATP-dependent 26S proteasome regulatory subunit